ncbi:phosphate acetyltransferase [Alphaproteobacteria bacterium]
MLTLYILSASISYIHECIEFLAQGDSMDTVLQNKTFNEIEIGDSASISRILTKNDIQLFAIMSGDVNPAHLDEEYASSDIFKKIVAHGMWGGTLISTVLGTMLPGPGTIYLGQTLKFLRPVTIGDRITVSVKVTEKENEKCIVKLQCSCINQDGKEVISGDAVVIAPTEKIRRDVIKLPQIELIEDQVPRYYDQLCATAAGLPPLKAAIVHPLDESSLMGAIEAAKDGIISPVLIGPEQKIKKLAEDLNVSITDYPIIPVEHSHAAAEVATELARTGEVDALVKGNLHTDELMRPVVQKTGGLRTERRISHIFVVLALHYPKPLLITDAAINIQPDLMTKRDIVQNAIDLFTCLYSSIPKVALLSAVETVTEKLPATLDATALCKMAERGQITGGILDGPLAFDNAISKEAANMKGIVSQVSGDVDILVVPNIEAGNIMYKQLRYLSHAEGAGIVLGAKVPIVLTSRAEGNIASRKVSCALALLYAHRKDGLRVPAKLHEVHS